MTAWYRKIDHVTLLTWLALIGISLAAIYSTTHGPAAEFLATSVQQNFQSQFIWAIICTVGVAIALMLPVRFYQRAAYPAYVFCLGLLLLTLAIGKESGGATSWLMIGGMTLQTSELAKVGTVMAVAKLLSSQPSGEEGRGGNVRYAAGAVALLIGPAALILVQNDPGTALGFLGLIPIMLFWSGLPLATCALMISPGVAGYFAIRGTTVGWWLWVAVAFAVVFTAGIWWATRKRYMAILAALFTGGVILVATVALNEVLALHQTARIKSFTNPDAPEYRKGVGFHLVQSKAAIGSGGLWGKGYMEG
ncbi:MAG: rod shape-determining protein RodA, partial [Bacteroidetes bacterium QS_1_65_9]